MMDEQEFQKKCDAAFESLRARLLELGDDHDFEVEGGSGKLEIEFEDERLCWIRLAKH
jgi:frataxin-like iron-binding protein CyaY